MMAIDKHKKYFEILTFVHKLREAGVSEKAAEIQAQAIADVIEQLSNHSNLTKTDLTNTDRKIEENHRDTKADFVNTDRKIEKLRHDTVIKIEELRRDLEVKMAQGFNKVLIWTFSMLTFFSCGLLGVLAKGFHWF